MTSETREYDSTLWWATHRHVDERIDVFFLTTNRGRTLARLAIAGTLAAAPLTMLGVPALAAPTVRVAPTDTKAHTPADCDRADAQDDKDLQDWCAKIRADWDGDLINPANPQSPLNPMNPANPNSPLNPMNPMNPNSPDNPANPQSPLNPMNQH